MIMLLVDIPSTCFSALPLGAEQTTASYVLLSSLLTLCTVKKSVDFTVKYLATSCQSISRYFYGPLLVEHF